jgi:integrase
MALKDTEIRALRSLEKPYRKADSGGLYIEVFPNGSKLWRWKFRAGGKGKRLALGAYPAVSLKEARHKRDTEKAKLLKGVDPAFDRKRGKVAAKISAANTFAAVAREYIDVKMIGEARAETTIKKAGWFLEQLEPAIGTMPIAEVDQQMLLAALMRVQTRGRYETAKKCRSFASRVFRYGVVTGRCSSDPSHLLKGALTTPQARHYAAILEPTKLGELLRAIDAFTGSPITRAALQIAPHVFVRPGELRHAEWAEFNLDDGIWNLPAAKMKARRAHAVPLSRQVTKMLLELRELFGSGKYVFPSAYGPSRPMSGNTLNASFRRMGFGKDEARPTVCGQRLQRCSTKAGSGIPTRSRERSRMARAMRHEAPIIAGSIGMSGSRWRNGGTSSWMSFAYGKNSTKLNGTNSVNFPGM